MPTSLDTAAPRGGSETGLDQPLRSSVVGAQTAAKFAKELNLHTVGELLHHYPRRYDERGEFTDLAALKVGEQVTVMARVQQANLRPMRHRKGRLLEVVVGNGRRSLSLTFFNQAWRERELTVGRWGLFAGKVTEFKGKRQLNSPDYQLLDPGSDTDSVEEFAGALIPVYPAAAGLPSWTIARAVRLLLDTLPELADPIPAELRRRRRLGGLREALIGIHRPGSRAELWAARHRLTWDEAFALQLTLAQRRLAAAAHPTTSRPRRDNGLLDALDECLPFSLTSGQEQVGKVISADLSSEQPMHRLLQGEVGSGKTVCALRAMLQVVDAGGQAALLAPTEVLAGQHLRSLRALLGPLGAAGELGAAEQATRITLFTGSQSAATRRAALQEVSSGAAGIVVGTHALLEEAVTFADLGLVVIDEQHRFGVEQRDSLRAKGNRPPHVLVMTATPIPRTVAMTVFGDLEISSLTELPSGRSPIASHVVPVADRPHFLDRAWQRITEEVAAGHQAYVVCPRIGDPATTDSQTASPQTASPQTAEAEDADLEIEDPGDGAQRRPPLAVLDVAPELAAGPLAGLNLGVLHGRLAPEEKDATMREFAAGKVQVLVATTVIEVGVDVPNATVMVVLDADRFGVSQLHQLRGRVGRGSAAGLCLLVTDAPAGTPSRVRLDAVASTVDGFELAELDLEQRREGDVLGAAQSGRKSALRLLSLLRDRDLITEARREATDLIASDPALESYPALAAAIATLVGTDRAEYLEKG